MTAIVYINNKVKPFARHVACKWASKRDHPDKRGEWKTLKAASPSEAKTKKTQSPPAAFLSKPSLLWARLFSNTSSNNINNLSISKLLVQTFTALDSHEALPTATVLPPLKQAGEKKKLKSIWTCAWELVPFLQSALRIGSSLMNEKNNLLIESKGSDRKVKRGLNSSYFNFFRIRRQKV